MAGHGMGGPETRSSDFPRDGCAGGIPSKTDRDDFWVEPGCAPGMDRDRTEVYLRRIGAAYRERGNDLFGEAFVAQARSPLYPPRPGPDEAAIGAWDRKHRVRLPAILRDALHVQDGGYVMGTRLQLRAFRRWNR